MRRGSTRRTICLRCDPMNKTKTKTQKQQPDLMARLLSVSKKPSCKEFRRPQTAE